MLARSRRCSRQSSPPSAGCLKSLQLAADLPPDPGAMACWNCAAAPSSAVWLIHSLFPRFRLAPWFSVVRLPLAAMVVLVQHGPRCLEGQSAVYAAWLFQPPDQRVGGVSGCRSRPASSRPDLASGRRSPSLPARCGWGRPTWCLRRTWVPFFSSSHKKAPVPGSIPVERANILLGPGPRQQTPGTTFMRAITEITPAR